MTSDSQTSRTALLVRPTAFGFNPEAARSNAFANDSADVDCAHLARREFDGLADALDRAGVEVMVLDDTPDPPKPDAVFPNNWVSFHGDGTILLYPMATAPRRAERRADALRDLLGSRGFEVRRTIDLSAMEQDGLFLEGTGSLILDRPARRAFAALGPRTSPAAIDAFTRATGVAVSRFDCADRRGQPIYHTNVMLSLGSDFAVVCPDAIARSDRDRVLGELADSDREIIPLDFDAMERFACNILELRGSAGPVIAMSATARDAFDPVQRRALERHGELVAVEIPTIERIGGGSVRCMIADVHLPRAP